VTAPHYISPPTLSNIDDRQEAAKEEVSEGENAKKGDKVRKAHY
jgi:hypothetical protein